MRDRLRAFLAFLAFLAVRALSRTFRFRLHGASYVPAPDAPRVLLAFEHGRQLPLLAYFDRLPGKRICLMSSTSRDGAFQAGILERLGYGVVRGSSSRRGAAALVGMARAIERERRDAALAVDGPRGPLGDVKPGIAWLAARTGAVVVPVSAAGRPAHVFARSWCGYRLPWPFARVDVAFGAPIAVPRGASPAALDQARARVGAALAALGARVDGAPAALAETGHASAAPRPSVLPEAGQTR